MVLGLDQVLERSLGLVPDHGPRRAPHRLRLEPALGLGGLDPPVHTRAPHHEPARNLIPRLAIFQRRHHHAPAQIA